MFLMLSLIVWDLGRSVPHRPQGSFRVAPAVHPADARLHSQPGSSAVAGRCSPPLCCQGRGGDHGVMRAGDESAVGCRLGWVVVSRQ